ncbi:MAG: hypothetical protein M3Y87_03955 [Myxococcota bacterium]|nr:hypothetical protein [Myxococcota bacterium]
MRFHPALVAFVVLVACDRAGHPAARSSSAAPIASTATAEPPAARPEVEAPTAWSAPCAALPEDFSERESIRLTLHDYDRPEATSRWDLISEQQACPAADPPAFSTPHPDCVRVPSADLEALHRALRQRGLPRLRTRPVAPTPHRGGYTITVDWGTGVCFVSAVTGESEVAPEDVADFGAAVDAVADAIRAAQ